MKDSYMVINELKMALTRKVWYRGWDPHLLKRVEGLKYSNTFEVVPVLVSLLARASGALKISINDVLMSHWAHLESEHWVEMGRQISQIVDYNEFDTVMRNLENGTDPELVIALLHSNGKIRQAALTYVNRLPLGIAICILLVRSNDWVESIRDLSVAKAEEMIHRLSEKEAVHVLPLMIHMRVCGRFSKPDVVYRWGQLLSKKISYESFAEEWSVATGSKKRLLLGVLRANGYTFHVRLIRLLLESNHKPSIKWLFGEFSEGLNAEQKMIFTQEIKQINYPLVLTLWMQSPHFDEQGIGEKEWFAYCMHQSAMVRCVARYYLKKRKELDFSQWYLEQLHMRASPSALYGLYEVAPARAESEALHIIDNGDHKMMAAAVHCLSCEYFQKKPDQLHRFLIMERSNVGKVAVRKLNQVAREYVRFFLSNLSLQQSASHNLWRQLFALVHRIGKWEGLELLLVSELNQVDDGVIETGFDKWVRVLNASFVRISHEHAEKLQRILNNSFLPDERKKLIREVLKAGA